MERFLRLRKEFFRIDDAAEYQLLTVQLHARGIKERRRLLGAQIKTKRQQRVKAGDLLVAEIDAKVGGFGIVPTTLEGAIVSSHYFLYEIDTHQVDLKYLEYYLKSGYPERDVGQFVKGALNYAAIRPRHFPQIEIPLPPLAEQQRIVARIDALAARIAEAQKLQAEAVEEAEGFYASERFKVFQKTSENGAEVKRLDEIAIVTMGQSPKGNTYNNDGNGVPLLNGPTEFGQHHPTEKQWTTAPTKLCKAGDILLCVRATIGRMNWADKEYCIGRGLAALTVNEGVCLPHYVYKFVEIQTKAMLEVAVGTTFPNLSGDKLKSLKIPVPPLNEQRRIVAYLDRVQARVDALKQLQAQTQKELDALLPSVLDKAFRGEL
jgi:type I restriction enzyme S subunit